MLAVEREPPVAAMAREVFAANRHALPDGVTLSVIEADSGARCPKPNPDPSPDPGPSPSPDHRYRTHPHPTPYPKQARYAWVARCLAAPTSW